MYMYYLLGHRLMELPISVDRKEVMAENTYLLTLDGDIDFQPNAVQLLVDLMKKNRNLGAACGRIHPVGSGMAQKRIIYGELRGIASKIYIHFQDLWPGTKFSNTPSVIGCKRLRSIWLVAFCAVPVASLCSEEKHSWMTTWWGSTRPSLRKRGTTCNMIKVWQFASLLRWECTSLISEFLRTVMRWNHNFEEGIFNDSIPRVINSLVMYLRKIRLRKKEALEKPMHFQKGDVEIFSDHWKWAYFHKFWYVGKTL